MICKLIRIRHTKDRIYLGGNGISNSTVSSHSNVEIHPDIQYTRGDGCGTIIGIGRHAPIGCFVEYELIERASRILRFEIDRIDSVTEDVVGEASL